MNGAESAGQPSRSVLGIAMAGVVTGFLAIVIAVGFANLLLPGEIRLLYTPAVVGMALFSTVVLNAVAALLSPIRGAVTCIQEVPIVVLSGVAALLAAEMADTHAPFDIFVTIIVCCMVTTVLVGLALLVLGLFRLGGLIRFVPFPVVGGFLAGTGWLLVFGGIMVVLNQPPTFDNLGLFAESGTAIKAAFALAFVVLAVVLARLAHGAVLVPAAIFAILVLYNVVVLTAGIGHETLRATGWLVPLPADGRMWPPIAPADLAAVDWGAVARGLLSFPGLIAVTVMALLMNATGIEINRGQEDLDLDRELRAVGISNLLAGPTGGIAGYPSVSLSLLATRLGGASRIIPAIVAVLAAAALIFGEVVLSAVPTPLLAGLLLWIGGTLIYEWLVASYRRLSIPEYLIIALIFLTIATIGFTWGILVGLVAAVAYFVVEYSRADVVRHILRGSDYQSNFEASGERREALLRHGDAILVCHLQGHLFFGTADGLRKRIVGEAAAKPGRPAARFVLLDLRRVTGIDSTAAASFVRLGQAAARHGFSVIFAGAGNHARRALERGGAADAVPVLRFADDVERALMECENALLGEVAPGICDAKTAALSTVLSRIVKNDGEAERLAGYFERAEFAAGASLIEENSPSDDIYVIESGQATVTMRGQYGEPIVLASIGPGAIVGEIAFYRDRPRSASVVADAPTVAWRFTRAALARLQSDSPALASRLHQGLAALLAERLADTDRLLGFLVE